MIMIITILMFTILDDAWNRTETGAIPLSMDSRSCLEYGCDEAGSRYCELDENNAVNCQCNVNFAGRFCRRCAHGRFRFPHCQGT